MRMIAVSSGKGGVGKTMATVNLGVLLASRGKKVAVVDCNLTNPHVGLCLGTFSVWPVTLNTVLRNEASLEQAIYTHSSGLKVVPASFESKDLERLSMHRLRSRMQRVFAGLGAEIVLLDSSPGLTREALLTLRCSNEVLFVATPHIPSVVDITKCLQLLKGIETTPLGVLLNRSRHRNYEMAPEEIAKFTNLPLLGTIPEDEHVLKATNFKSPVVTSFPHAPASKALLRLAASLLGEEQPLPSPGFFAQLAGLLRRPGAREKATRFPTASGVPG